MAGRKISAIKIKKLRYAEPLVSAPTKEGLKVAFDAAKKIENVHQDTFQYEETEAQVNTYKNQLTGQIYRSEMTPGDVSIRFSIGQYDFATKADLQGGTADADSWERGTAAQRYKCIYAVTEDDVCIVFPKANVIATGSSVDNAVAIAMQAIPQEVSGLVASEYWIDATELSLQD